MLFHHLEPFSGPLKCQIEFSQEFHHVLHVQGDSAEY